MIDIAKEEIHILQHSLGLTYSEHIYRNYYAASPDEASRFDGLIEKGLMVRSNRNAPGTDLVYYFVTDAGKQVALDNMPVIPKAKKRYQRFLNAKDAYPDLTFQEFLTHPFWKDARENP
jgi:hypothetical protein